MRIESLLCRSARLYPEAMAVVDARRSLRYPELEDQARRMASVLLARGARPGDRVAIISKNRWEYAALYFAAASVGAVVVPINWRLGLAELRFVLGDAAPKIVLAEPSHAQLLEPLRAELEGATCFLALGDPLPGWEELESILSAAPPLERFEREPSPEASHEVVVQMYTSGTTGQPKAALLTHRNLVTSIAAALRDFGFRPGADRFLQVTPLFHVGGVLMVVTCAAASVTLRLLAEFEPGAAARCLASEGVTHTLMVPAMLRWLFADAGTDARAFPDLRLVAYGAAPMPLTLMELAMDRLRCAFFQGYGLTETAALLTILSPEDHVLDGSAGARARLASAGRAMLGAEVRVVDPEGIDVRVGEVGEVVGRGANVSPGYFCLPEATREANRGGWFWTGDLGYLDDAGYLTLVDRSKDMILLGGENIYPREVELALLEHPDVVDCAVIGIPHEVWGEEVMAFASVVPSAKTTARELIAHCRKGLSRYKCPTRLELLDAIPRNAAGKIEKARLREPYWAGKDRRV